MSLPVSRSRSETKNEGTFFCKKITFSFCSKCCNGLTFFFELRFFGSYKYRARYNLVAVPWKRRQSAIWQIGGFSNGSDTFSLFVLQFSLFQSSLSLFSIFINLYFHFSVFSFHLFYFNFSLSLCSHFTFDLHDLTNRNIYTQIGSLFTRRTMKILSIQ